MVPKSIMPPERRQDRAQPPDVGFCEEKNQLAREFAAAIHELIEIQNQQTRAVIDGDPDFARFDILVHMALERKEQAKYAWILHVESHRCEEG